MAEEDESSNQARYRLDRTLALSDGVFAFAITLLVLDLFVPTLSTGATSMDLWKALSEEYITFFSYLLSFIIAGLWWGAHNRNFEMIRSSDSVLQWLNLAFLLWIALLPFFTKILDENSNLQIAVDLYAIDQACAGIFLMLSWLYASRNHRLIYLELPERSIWFTSIINVIAPLFFIISIGVSFINPSATFWVWYTMFPFIFLAHRLQRRSLRQPRNSLKKI
jgi:uncharacterized membrane protein